MRNEYKYFLDENKNNFGRKNYTEEFWINSQIVSDRDLLHCHSYMESIWYPNFSASSGEYDVGVITFIEMGTFNIEIYSNDNSLIKKQTIKAGDIIILDGHSFYKCKVVGNIALKRKAILMNKNTFFNSIIGTLFSQENIIISINDCTKIDEIFKKIKTNILENPELVSSSIFHLLEEVYKQKRPNSYSETVAKAINFIEMNISKNFSCYDIARHCETSERTLSRMFQKELKVSPIRYLLDLRLNQAKNLLAFNRMNVKIAASICGFSNWGYFNRAFKDKFGITPGKISKMREKRH